MESDYRTIKEIEIDEDIDDREEYVIFQRAMSLLEDEMLSFQDSLSRGEQFPFYAPIESSKQYSLMLIEEEKKHKLSVIRPFTNEIKKIDKKYDIAKKALLEATLSNQSKCDNNLSSQFKSLFMNKRKKFDDYPLATPRCANDDQIVKRTKSENRIRHPPAISEHEKERDFAGIARSLSHLLNS